MEAPDPTRWAPPDPQYREQRLATMRRSPNWRGDDIGYDAAHTRAWWVMAGHACAHADGTCRGRLDMAFRHDAPPDRVRFREDGRPYSPDPTWYQPLCQSHHKRYDNEHRRP